MKIKLNWGTSIFIFIIVFLTLCTVAIIFSLRHDIDLVTDDYYEEGADYTSAMELKERSKIYNDSLSVTTAEGSLSLELASCFAFVDRIDLWFYRPSDRDSDYRTWLKPSVGENTIGTESLAGGRYVLYIS